MTGKLTKVIHYCQEDLVIIEFTGQGPLTRKVRGFSRGLLVHTRAAANKFLLSPSPIDNNDMTDETLKTQQKAILIFLSNWGGEIHLKDDDKNFIAIFCKTQSWHCASNSR